MKGIRIIKPVDGQRWNIGDVVTPNRKLAEYLVREGFAEVETKTKAVKVKPAPKTRKKPKVEKPDDNKEETTN